MGSGGIFWIQILVQCTISFIVGNSVVGQTYNPGPYIGTACEGVFTNFNSDTLLYDKNTYSYTIDL